MKLTEEGDILGSPKRILLGCSVARWGRTYKDTGSSPQFALQCISAIPDPVFSAGIWWRGQHLLPPSPGPPSGLMTQNGKTPEVFHRQQHGVKLFATMPLIYPSTCIRKQIKRFRRVSGLRMQWQYACHRTEPTQNEKALWVQDGLSEQEKACKIHLLIAVA